MRRMIRCFENLKKLLRAFAQLLRATVPVLIEVFAIVGLFYHLMHSTFK
jgi:hypothetical protein